MYLLEVPVQAKLIYSDGKQIRDSARTTLNGHKETFYTRNILNLDCDDSHKGWPA